MDTQNTKPTPAAAEDGKKGEGVHRPLRLLHIFGNGLDLAFGLKTRYLDFLQGYYLNEEKCDPSGDSENVRKLKDHIRESLDELKENPDGYESSWANAEWKMGEYNGECEGNRRQYMDAFEDFRDKMKIYVGGIDKGWKVPESLSAADFLTGIFFPYMRLNEGSERFKNALKECGCNPQELPDVEVLTFNYTKTLEKMEEGVCGSKKGKMISKFLHIHGKVGGTDDLIFGVNDKTQIKGADGLPEFDIENVVKPMHNDAYRNNNNKLAKEMIEWADVISLYGVSIGATDKDWWKLIWDRLTAVGSTLHLLYFPYDSGIDIYTADSDKIASLTKGCRDTLKSRLKVGEDEGVDAQIVKDVDARIFVGLNRPLFVSDEQARRDWEREKNPRTFEVGGVKFDMIRVEGGTFQMGAAKDDKEADDDERLAHSVTLSDYYIGETPVTQALWEAVTGENPSDFKGDDRRPVENVSWFGCQGFIKKLNEKLKKELNGATFRLPTEAEWEYAARGGKKSKGYKYSGSNNINEVAWYGGNSGSGTHPVKQKKPNELGLYDMSGNVWEQCGDRYGGYSSSKDQTNPTGSENGSNRVFRGGSWNNYAWYCRVSYRNDNYPSYRRTYLGLRLVLLP